MFELLARVGRGARVRKPGLPGLLLLAGVLEQPRLRCLQRLDVAPVLVEQDAGRLGSVCDLGLQLLDALVSLSQLRLVGFGAGAFSRSSSS